MSAKRASRILSAMASGMGLGALSGRARLAAAIDEASRMTAAGSDLEALRGDWMKIGADFREAAKKLETELGH